VTTVTKDKVLGELSFPMPSPAALAFNLAFESARAASASRARLTFIGSRRGPKKFEQEHVPTLFTYFEQMMSTVVFSFQCIEAYANEEIANYVKGPMEIPRKNGIERLSPEELERKLTTEEKLTIVLPQLRSIRSPKGKASWGHFRELKDVRDSTVHLKSRDQYVRGKIDNESVYHRLLRRRAYWYPTVAVQLIRHFCLKTPPRWLEAAGARLRTWKDEWST